MGEHKPIRVIIADDQAIVRSGLGAFLMAFDGLQLVGEASDGAEAIQLCELIQPDVVLMDVKMPNMDGISATRIIHQRWPKIHILVLTSFRDKDIIQGALEAGASGYLLKNITAQELAHAIRQIQQGQRTVAQEATQALVQAEHLDKLAEDIRSTIPNTSILSDLLGKHLPNIFPECVIKIRVFPGQDLLVYPANQLPLIPEPAWEWLRKKTEPRAFYPGDEYPWGSRQAPGNGLILAPILSASGQALGGIGIALRHHLDDLTDLFPVVRSLAMHISSGLETVQSPSRRPDSRRLTQELVTAGKIQVNILPEKSPTIRGWALTAKLEPARETSGDFYDFIPLANGNWGIVIADVTDKGMGAALFMALSSTLIRTYAAQYPTLPAFAMSAVNRRILSDTRGSMFVTAFYGVLEPASGRLRYVNAGHNPPFLVSAQKGKPVDSLRRTGMALGVMEDASWQQKVVRFSPGDILFMYTDGVTEAQNRQGQFFGDQRILDTIRLKMGCSVREIQDALLAELHSFIGDAPKQDDVTLVILSRDH